MREASRKDIEWAIEEGVAEAARLRDQAVQMDRLVAWHRSQLAKLRVVAR